MNTIRNLSPRLKRIPEKCGPMERLQISALLFHSLIVIAAFPVGRREGLTFFYVETPFFLIFLFYGYVNKANENTCLYVFDETMIREMLMNLFSDEALWQSVLQTKKASSFVQKSRKKTVREAFREFIDDEVLESWEAQGYLYSGQSANMAACIEKLSKLESQSFLDTLKNDVELEFTKSNVDHTDMKSPLEVTVRAKNTGDIMCKVFEINTQTYYREKQEDLKTDLSLDGFHAAHEWTIQPKAQHSFHRVTVKIPLPKELQSKRGVFFVDLFGNGHHSRAVIQRGVMTHIERCTESGHKFVLLDEDHEVIKNASIWMSGHTYQSNTDNGEIHIPFSTKPQTQKIILQRNDDPKFNVLTSFEHKAETYQLQCGFYLDREQMLAKKQATVIVRPGLLLNGNRVTVDLLENVQLFVEVKTMDSRGINKTFDNLKVFDHVESYCTISMPMNVTDVVLRLSCQVTNQSQSSKVDLEKSQSFQINGIHTTNRISCSI
ncbi:hypothetical protein RFI_26011 [Reticulomyxa filosa]|uniref:Uncharacterized protein n=1 Tax=Reticulomyxa filosa TaxID=46433 RepID=X6MEC6_RETFI|nr:hypothetical protein RFI_26011 [Reticulomyxa filosa]|eukprot:ETO11365.1 hypothetical protein RFI_26011 [Reticulomyxa filosa]